MIDLRDSPNVVEESPIRVCYVLDELRQGGTELRLLRLLAALPGFGISPSLVLLRNKSSELRQKVKCPVLDLGLRSLRSVDILKKCRSLHEFLREQRVQILEPYFFDAIVLSVPIARMAGVELIIRTSFNMGHSISIVEKIAYRILKPFFSCTLTNSEQGRAAAQKNFGLTIEKVAILPNGIDLSSLLSIPIRENVVKNSFHVGMVANLRPVKGVADFIEAARLLIEQTKNVRFSVAGDGPQRNELERMIERYGLSTCFSFKGSLSNIAEYLSELDIAVLASHAEGMSNALIEYMAAGKPVIATKVGGAAELIGEQERGVLVDARQPNAIYCAMKEVIDNYEVATKKAVRARFYVASRFTVERMAEEYAGFYREHYNNYAVKNAAER